MTQTKNSLPVQTERLRLRELEASDFDAVHAYTSDPFVVRFMPWGPNSETDTRDFLLRARSLADAQPRLGYELAIAPREGAALVGAIGLHRTDDTSSEAMLGYCLARPAWGHGYATEAGLAVIGFGFADLGLESVWAGCDTENAASIRVLEKLGMRVHSEHVHDAEVRAGWRESLMFRIRSSEWAGSTPAV